MENVINERAETLKGFQANIEAKLEETNAAIKVVRDEAQKQFRQHGNHWGAAHPKFLGERLGR